MKMVEPSTSQLLIARVIADWNSSTPAQQREIAHRSFQHLAGPTDTPTGGHWHDAGLRHN